MHNEMVLLGGTANPALTASIARELGVTPGACEVERFPDGELTVRLLESVRDREVYVVQPTSPPVNDHLVELLAFADACRRAAAARITAVLAEAVREHLPEDAVIVSPDAGRVRLATEYAHRLDLPLAVLHKERTGGATTRVTHLVGEVRGRRCIIVDDMISTGGTLVETLSALRVVSVAPLLARAIRQFAADGLLEALG